MAKYQPMIFNTFESVISATGYLLEAFGVLIIVIGAIRSTIRGFRKVDSVSSEVRFRTFRWEIGRAMLLGLEFLVAGDIIRTVVVENSVADVLSLGLVVLIRTLLVFTIHLEVEGRWPWQPAPK
jgi:uncharacterized membrane protein